MNQSKDDKHLENFVSELEQPRDFFFRKGYAQLNEYWKIDLEVLNHRRTISEQLMNEDRFRSQFQMKADSGTTIKRRLILEHALNEDLSRPNQLTKTDIEAVSKPRSSSEQLIKRRCFSEQSRKQKLMSEHDTNESWSRISQWNEGWSQSSQIRKFDLREVNQTKPDLGADNTRRLISQQSISEVKFWSTETPTVKFGVIN